MPLLMNMACPATLLTCHCPHEVILRRLYDDHFAGKQTASEWKYNFTPSTIDTCDSPFDPADCEAFEITLPPKGYTIGMSISTDED